MPNTKKKGIFKILPYFHFIFRKFDLVKRFFGVCLPYFQKKKVLKYVERKRDSKNSSPKL